MHARGLTVYNSCRTKHEILFKYCEQTLFYSEIQTCYSKNLGHFKMKKMSKYPSKLLSNTLKSFHYDILTEPR